MKWIKAIERLPSDNDKKAARQNGEYMQLQSIFGEIIKVKGFNCHSLEILEEWFPGIEWLDETDPNQEILWNEVVDVTNPPYFCLSKEEKEQLKSRFTLTRKP